MEIRKSKKWAWAVLTVMALMAGAWMHRGYSQGTFQGARVTKPMYKAIFQLDSDSQGTMKKTLNNIKNALQDPRLKGKVKIELIANSLGYKVYLKGNGFEKLLRRLQAQGVILAQCSNTIRELKIDKKTLYPFISFVPSAAGELIIREGNGWAYVHPS